ncbi:MAG: iron-containing alcohol dehydrogenase [Bacteroidales bacterium]|nr:iron-containing alcohol dehydrogenase [Bacteroidales bacterium]
MENFIAYNPTKLHFGKNVVDDLGKAVNEFGKKVLLVYGGGSIKKNGIYDNVIKQLKSINSQVFEYPGIKPNPVVEDVNAAAELGRKNNVDVILGVGGGSVIDSAKIISITIPVNNTCWDFYENKIKPQKAIPVISVLTLAATGTEMNPYAVIQNNKTRQKWGYGNDLLYLKHSFLDPQNTFTVPKNYTAYGITDLIAHCLEAYFGKGDATLSDSFVYAIIKEAIKYGPPLLFDLQNYDLRAKIMYAATTALNRTTLYGRVSGDWGVHSIGHVLSLLYDVPHGASLSIAYPAWLKFQKNNIPDRIAELGKNIFNVNTPDETITAFEAFFKSIECPINLSEIGIGKDNKQEIYDVMISNKVDGMNHKLNPEDYEKIIDLMLSPL